MNAPARKNEQQNLPASRDIVELPEGYDASTPSLAVSMAIAEVDQQITTAHAYPRSIDKAMKNILALATMDEETAKECIYALPRAGKAVKGPSIRLAEIIQGQYGNNRVGTRVTHVDRLEKYVEAEGVFHDLETNAATTARVRRRISDAKGRLFNDDMIMVTSNAAASIAKRNAILGGVPKAIWRRAYDEVQRVLIGDVRTMALKREDAIKAFAGFGVKPEQLYEVLEIGGADDIGIEEYTTLLGMHQAIRNGEATVEEMFPARKDRADKPGNLGDRLDRLAGDDGASPERTMVEGDASGNPPASGAMSGEAKASPEDGSSQSPPAPAAAAPDASARPEPQSDRADAIERLLKLVGDKATSDQEKLESLESLQPAYDHLPAEFSTVLFLTIAKVVRKELTAAAAKKFLEQLKG